jgi:predicted aspartyl protease
VRISAPGEPFSAGPLRALIDTGADVSIIPLRFIEPLGAQITSRRYLRGYGGSRRRVDVYLVDVGVGDLRLPGIEVVADELDEEIIIGRNVLNRLTVILDGPHQVAEIRE